VCVCCLARVVVVGRRMMMMIIIDYLFIHTRCFETSIYSFILFGGGGQVEGTEQNSRSSKAFILIRRLPPIKTIPQKIEGKRK